MGLTAVGMFTPKPGAVLEARLYSANMPAADKDALALWCGGALENLLGFREGGEFLSVPSSFGDWDEARGDFILKVRPGEWLAKLPLGPEDSELSDFGVIDGTFLNWLFVEKRP